MSLYSKFQRLKNGTEKGERFFTPNIPPKPTTTSIPSKEMLENDIPTNIAEWTYKRLGKYINDFEASLDDEHEIGARLVSFGQEVIFHIQDIGFYGPDIINFDGINQTGKKVQLIQHISQLSVLLVAMEKLNEKPRRIGFIWDDDKQLGSE